MIIKQDRNIGLIPIMTHFELKKITDGILDYLMTNYHFSNQHAWTVTLPYGSETFVCIQDTYSIDFNEKVTS